MKTVLVTGATGFLGKYVIEELVQHGYQVRAFGRNSKVGCSLENSSVSFFFFFSQLILRSSIDAW